MQTLLHGSFRLVIGVVITVLCGSSTVFAQTVQEHVHHMSHGVMPFDMSQTVHIFRMTESGGVQRVIAKDAGAADQIKLIQEHLKHEAGEFEQGNYSDPARLHGAGMPGLKELQAGTAAIKISYTEMPLGAAITFTTDDLYLLTAIHRWFGAQLSEHGADAKAE